MALGNGATLAGSEQRSGGGELGGPAPQPDGGLCSRTCGGDGQCCAKPHAWAVPGQEDPCNHRHHGPGPTSFEVGGGLNTTAVGPPPLNRSISLDFGAVPANVRITQLSVAYDVVHGSPGDPVNLVINDPGGRSDQLFGNAWGAAAIGQINAAGMGGIIGGFGVVFDWDIVDPEQPEEYGFELTSVTAHGYLRLPS